MPKHKGTRGGCFKKTHPKRGKRCIFHHLYIDKRIYGKPILETDAETPPKRGDPYIINNAHFYVRCVVPSDGDSYDVCVQLQKPRHLAKPVKVAPCGYDPRFCWFESTNRLSPHIKTAYDQIFWDTLNSTNFAIARPLKQADASGEVDTTKINKGEHQIHSLTEIETLCVCNPNRPFLVSQIRGGFVSTAVVCCIID